MHALGANPDAGWMGPAIIAPAGIADDAVAGVPAKYGTGHCRALASWSVCASLVFCRKIQVIRRLNSTIEMQWIMQNKRREAPM
jgi:hypothetical protein